MGRELLAKLPEALASPLAILASKTKKGTSVVAMLRIRQNGKQVITPVVIDGFGTENSIQLDSNAITSVYGKKYSIARILRGALESEAEGNFSVYYVDEEETTELFRVARVPMPKMPETDGGFIHSIREADSPVKPKFLSQTDTQQFKRWFKGSKVINDDGSPKVMYHGTPYGGFTVFKDWQYFTENSSYADKYQNPSASSIRGRYDAATNPMTYAAYLRVRNPFDTRIPEVREIWANEFYDHYHCLIFPCTSQQKLDTRTRKIGHENRVSKDAILDRTLKNDVVAIPTAKNSSAIGEYLAVGDCIVSFFKNPSRTSHLRRWLRRR